VDNGQDGNKSGNNAAEISSLKPVSLLIKKAALSGLLLSYLMAYW
jgi:hypothetical protein